MSKHIVKTPVIHDQVNYAPGESIELDAKTAEALIAVGAIERAERAPAKGKSNQGGSSGEGGSTGAGE